MKKGLLFELSSVFLFLFLFFYGSPKVFSQCSTPYLGGYDGRNTAYMTSAGLSQTDADEFDWTSKNIWGICKGKSNFFNKEGYPAYLTNNDLNNVYIQISEGTFVRADRMQGGNNLTLVVCGKLIISDFVIPDISFSVIVSADPPTFSKVGDIINFSVRVYNFDLENTLSNVQVTIPDLGINIPYLFDFLSPDSYDEFSFPYTVTQTDMDNEHIEFTALATGLAPGATDPESVQYSETIYYSPISITKNSNKTTFSQVGDVITYTITVTNLVESSLSDIFVKDDLFSGDEFVESNEWTIASLFPSPDPNSSFSFSYTYTISETDIARQEIFNTVTATVGGDYPTTTSVIVQNIAFNKLGEVGLVKTDIKGEGKIETKNISVFNRVRIFVCPTGTLIMDNIDAQNNVQIYNYGTFMFEQLTAGPAQGGGVPFCITGPGVYTDQTGAPIVSVTPIVNDQGVTIDYNYGIVNPDAFGGTHLLWMTGPDCNIPLPIELLSFTPSIKPDRIELKWTTGTEINNDYFTLERSRDLYGWEVLGFVPGAGNSSVPLSYSFSDLRPLDGLAYYRLKQTDFDGKFEYFGPIAAHYDLGMEGLDFKVLKQYTNWVIAVPNDGVYQVEVYNLQGHRLVSEKIENTITIPAPESAVVIRVTDGFARSASRVVM
jgi:uncharacterized repeat protein (TIGR01451 family)